MSSKPRCAICLGTCAPGREHHKERPSETVTLAERVEALYAAKISERVYLRAAVRASMRYTETYGKAPPRWHADPAALARSMQWANVYPLEFSAVLDDALREAVAHVRAEAEAHKRLMAEQEQRRIAWIQQRVAHVPCPFCGWPLNSHDDARCAAEREHEDTAKKGGPKKKGKAR